MGPGAQDLGFMFEGLGCCHFMSPCVLHEMRFSRGRAWASSAVVRWSAEL